MATNLLINVRIPQDSVPTPKVYGWLDSIVALHRLQGNGQYKELHKEIT